MKTRERWSILTVVSLLVAATAWSQAPLTDPYEILNAHYDAMGGLETLRAIETRYYEADISLMGMEGQVKAWEETPLRNRREMSLGVLKMATGDNGEVSWVVDPNGKVQIEKDEATLKRKKIEALMESYEHADPESEHFTLTLDGTEKVRDIDCYVIKIINGINEDVRFRYFDTATLFQVKAVDPQENFEVHTLVSDYRPVGGIQIPFHREAEILPLGQKQIIQITRYELDVVIDPAMFDPPEKDAEDFTFVEGEDAEDIPFDYVLDHLYLDVNISGQWHRWVLDTGASSTVVDSTFAAAIGLETIGKAKAIGAGGTVDIDLVTLPPIQIRGIRLEEQRVGAMPLRDLFAKRGIEIAGVLGYDFLSRFVTRIDYANKTISFFHPESFEYNGEGAIIDAPLTHRLFNLPMTVDGRYTGNWALDIGASITTFQYPFAEENGLLDLEGVDRIVGGAGGHLRARVSEFESIELGPYRIDDPLILVPLENLGALSFKRGTGILGNNILRRFVVYLDYSNQRIILEKGADFESDFAKDRNGLSIVLTPEGDYEVFFVSAGTPAADAGFIKGDLVRSINGIGVDHLGDPVELSDLFREDVGTEYEVEILREGEPGLLRVTLRDLYRAPATAKPD